MQNYASLDGKLPYQSVLALCGRQMTRLPRRKFFQLAAATAALPSVPRAARAQAYPTRPVRAVVASVTSKRRSQIFPDVPTMTEAGHPEIEGDSWVGILVPAGTPAGIVTALHAESAKILAQPDMQERLAALGYDVVASTPEEFAIRIKTEIDMWAEVIRAANIKAE